MNARTAVLEISKRSHQRRLAVADRGTLQTRYRVAHELLAKVRTQLEQGGEILHVLASVGVALISR